MALLATPTAKQSIQPQSDRLTWRFRGCSSVGRAPPWHGGMSALLTSGPFLNVTSSMVIMLTKLEGAVLRDWSDSNWRLRRSLFAAYQIQIGKHV